MYKFFLTVSLCGVLLLLSGCGQTAEAPSTDINADENPSTQPIPQLPPEGDPDRPKTKDPVKTSQLSDLPAPPIDGFTLTLEEINDDEATFSWQIEEDLMDGDRFRFVRSEEPNPTYDELNFWYQVHNSHREATWTELPEGEWYVRLCTVDTEADPETCLNYSNDVVVNIK